MSLHAKSHILLGWGGGVGDRDRFHFHSTLDTFYIRVICINFGNNCFQQLINYQQLLKINWCLENVWTYKLVISESVNF